MLFEAANIWTEVLKAARLAPPPPGYRRVSWAQLRNADRKIWQLASAKCKGGCKAKKGETRTQFEEAFLLAIFAPEVRHLLNPLPDGGSSLSAACPRASGSAGPDQSAMMRRLEGRLKSAEDQLRGQKRRPQEQGNRVRSDGKSAKKGGGGGGADPRKQFLEKGFIGRTKGGEPVCFHYNLPGGCTKAQPGQRCVRGLHVCGSPQCQDSRQPHSATTH